MSPDTLGNVLALGTFVLQVVTVAILAAYMLRTRFSFLADVLRPVADWGLLLGLIASFVASAFTLYYSEILGFAPCPLCWWQRIFLYPQIIMFAIALWKRDYGIIPYSIAFSAVGGAFALYHHALQVLPSGSLPCPATTVSCAQRTIFEFGYITFPMMAVTVFAFLIVVMIIVRQRTAA